jgi:hypothetical protein
MAALTATKIFTFQQIQKKKEWETEDEVNRVLLLLVRFQKTFLY